MATYHCDGCQLAVINGVPAHETGCYESYYIKTASGRIYHDYDLISLDVWGDSEDGWEVNDAYTTGDVLRLPEDWTMPELIRALKRINRLSKWVKASSFEDTSHIPEDIYLDHRPTGEPIYQLRRK